MNSQRAESAKTYYTIQITTASTTKTICFIHEHCAFLLRQARVSEDAEWRSLFDKVQNLLSILERSLHITDPTSKTLLLLYDYCYCQLESTTPLNLENALRVIDTLRKTFNVLQYSP